MTATASQYLESEPGPKSVSDQIRASHQCALRAVADHNKPLAVQHMNAIDPVLGNGYHPARYPLRCAQAAVDIGRWDLAASRLIEFAHTLDPHSSPQG